MSSHKKKTRFMQIAITIFAVVILFFWLSNIDNAFQKTKELSNNEGRLKWQEFKADLDKTIESVNHHFQAAKKENQEENIKEDSDALIDDLITATEKLASSTITIPSDNPEAPIINNNCPEWIDCMPTIDAKPRPCVIPPGCEGITQIAY